MKLFVEFIAPEQAKREKLKNQTQQIKDCIERHANDDGYTIISSVNSGSFAKKTGLRRYMQGDSEVEGQDIDIAFTLEDKDPKGNTLGCLVDVFEGYLNACWPESNVGHTRSSATISFEGSKNRFDAVPLIKTKRLNIQKLIRRNNEKRQSSVKKQTEFIRKRSDESNDIKGVVKFNDCLRLVKWWRYQQQSNSGIFGNDENDKKVPSFLLDLLCAKAYDELKVRATYIETLARWFGYLAHVTRNREEILFNDFIQIHSDREQALWKVIDPIDDLNNVVYNWKDIKIDELADWFENSRDAINRAIRYDREEDDNSSMDCLVQLFGSSIKTQSKNL